MSDNEIILKYKGRMEEKGTRADELKTRGQGLVKSLVNLLDPTVPIIELDVDIALSQMTDLANVWTELKEVMAEISLIKKTLGR